MVNVSLVSREPPSELFAIQHRLAEGFFWWNIVDEAGNIISWLGAGPVEPGMVAVGMIGAKTRIITTEGPPYIQSCFSFLALRGYCWTKGMREVLELEAIDGKDSS